jgi:hypothetical protein
MSSADAAARGRPDQRCARPGGPQDRAGSRVPKRAGATVSSRAAEDARRQGALRAECAETRHARAEASRAAGRGRRRVGGARGGTGRRVGAGRRAPPSRYRGAAMAEFWALRTLTTLQAKAAVEPPRCLRPRAASLAMRLPLPPAALAPNEPEPRAEHRVQYVLPGRPGPGSTLHEPAVPWTPNEPEPARSPEAPLDYVLSDRPAPGGTLHETASPWTPNEPERHPASAPEPRPDCALPHPPALGSTLPEPAAPWTPNEPEPARDRPKPLACSPHRTASLPCSNEPDSFREREHRRW